MALEPGRPAPSLRWSYVLPEELVDGVKAALGIEMTRVGWKKLLEHLTKEQ